MRFCKSALIVFAFVATASAQSIEPSLTETRLTVHTLLREDIFAGFLDNNMERMARGEQNIARLMELRPEQRANLLAWKAGAGVYHAVRAHEAGKADEFARLYKESREEFATARQLSNGNDGVLPIMGGTYALFADRLPAEVRAAAWSDAYQAYSMLWKAQGPQVEQLPLHMKGELLAGLAVSAQRTGHADESAQHVDRMLTLLANTQYEKAAKEWKADPASAAATTTLTCKTCHAPGRLSARMAAIAAQK